MAQFQVIDVYQRSSNPICPPLFTITADSIDVEGTTAIFYNAGVKTAMFNLSSQFLVQQAPATKTGL